MLSPRENWIVPGTYAVFFFDDGKTGYAEVLRPSPGERHYLQCRVHTEGEPTDVFDVHVSKFVYKLSRAQFTTAWYSGFPDHPRRFQAIVNLVKGGDA